MNIVNNHKYFWLLINSICFSIDGTAESKHLGRLINHSKKNFNIVTKSVMIDDIPRLYFEASRYIKVDEELLYDYKDRSAESVKHFPWLLL